MSRQPDTDASSRYESTRRAWQDIWSDASVEVELETVNSARSMETIRAYLPYLSKTDPILEAGSGLSAVVITLRKLGYNVFGLDYAENALRISRDYDATLLLTVGDVHKLAFASNSLGAYLSFGVLEHFEHGMQSALVEARRVLKVGGVLVLTIPYPNVIHRLVAWRRKRQGVNALTDDEFYESTYTRKALEAEVTKAGFQLVRVQPTSHSFTLWGLGGVFRAPGYYRTSGLAEIGGKVLRILLPWAFNYMTLVVARK